MMKYKIIGFIVLVTIFACSRYPRQVNKALDLAGKNKTELLKVLEHYSQNPSDSLKLKAAYFLIENMINKGYRWSEEFDKFQNYIIDSMRNYESKQVFSNFIPVRKHLKNMYFDSLIANYERQNEKLSDINLDEYSDLETISASLLIENIDFAFKAWQMPWSKHVNFEDFCEYILPYRYGNEKTVSWRPFLMEYFKWVKDSIKNPNDPVEVCRFINNKLSYLPYSMNSRLGDFSGSFSYEFILYGKNVGACTEESGIALLAMRALGVPVCLLHTTWGNFSANHTFNAVLDTNGIWRDFMGAEKSPGQHNINDYANYTPTKINNLRFSDSQIERYNPKLDYTDMFISTSDLILKQPKDDRKSSSYSINVFSKNNWKSLNYTSSVHDSIIFPKLGRKNVYLVTSMGRNFSVFYPIAVDSAGNKFSLVPNKRNLIKMKLSRRRGILKSYYTEANDLVGIKFQGANNLNFADAHTLYTVIKAPQPFPTINLTVTDKAPFRYVRIVFPCINRPWVKSLTKAGFFTQVNKQAQGIKGRYIYSKGIASKQTEKLFTEGMLTQLIQYEPSLEGLNLGDIVFINKEKCGAFWVGIELERPTVISSIEYSPRNDKSYVSPGKQYELFYWDNEWVSAGIKTANDYFVEYSNIPSNALYLLKEQGSAQEERIFTYENGEQIFW